MTNQEPPTIPDNVIELSGHLQAIEVAVNVIVPEYLLVDFSRYVAALTEAGRPDLARKLHIRVDDGGWYIGCANTDQSPMPEEDIELLVRAGEVCGAESAHGQSAQSIAEQGDVLYPLKTYGD